MNKKITNIDDYLDSLEPKALSIVQQLRFLVQKNVPQSVETIAWSTPWFKLNNKWFVVIMNSSRHVGFGFNMGTSLKSELLEGTGKNMRHIKIPHGGEVPQKEIVRLLKDAAELEFYKA